MSPEVARLLDGLLAAGIVGVVVQAIISNRRVAKERKKELHGLLRLLLVEIEGNDRTMEMMLHGRYPGTSRERFEDEVWKESRIRLAELVEEEHHFHHLNLYYRNNATLGGFPFELAELGYDLREPKTFPAATAKKVLKKQREMARTSRQIILSHVPESSGRYPAPEEVDEAVRRIERELEERDRAQEGERNWGRKERRGYRCPTLRRELSKRSTYSCSTALDGHSTRSISIQHPYM